MAFKGFVFLDTETTGLDPAECAVLEIGIVLTDENLNEIDSRHWITKTKESAQSFSDLYSTDDFEGSFVRNMHIKSGLKDQFETARTFDRLMYVSEIVNWLYGRDADKMPMCGSSINFDRGFLQKHYPEVNDIFHYRNVDVSTLKEFVKTTRPSAYAEVEKRVEKATGRKEAAHRTIADCRNSLEQLRAYDEIVMVPRGDQ